MDLLQVFFKIFFKSSKIIVYNEQYFLEQFYRKKGNSLLTACNHTSTLDDPGLLAVLLPWKSSWNSFRVRWSLGAKEIMFKNPLFNWFFKAGQVIPIERGAGIEQEGVYLSIKKLNEGEWVHIFPEGKVNQLGKILPLRWGIGKIIAEADKTPPVLLFYHVGMDKILPGGSGFYNRFVPRPFQKKVFVIFGKPINFEEMIKLHREKGNSPKILYKEITDTIQKELKKLETEINIIKDRKMSS